jgi:dUTP pyrophosphatase
MKNIEKDKTKIKVKVVNKSKNNLPQYETPHSAGLDLRADLDVMIYLRPGDRTLIQTGLHIELPNGYAAFIQPRSGLAVKNGISIVNSPGLIDSDYRGEIKVILINHGIDPIKINPGDRIAQMVILKVEQIEWESSEELSETERGEGGFGHTGK